MIEAYIKIGKWGTKWNGDISTVERLINGSIGNYQTFKPLSSPLNPFAKGRDPLRRCSWRCLIIQSCVRPNFKGCGHSSSSFGVAADGSVAYLVADGGNVALRAIYGNAVRLKLQGECGSCPNPVSTVLMEKPALS